MAQKTYELDDIATLNAAFSINGVATDPTTVTAVVRKPDGTITNYTTSNGITNDPGAGAFHLDVRVDVPGQWSYKFVGSGAVVDVGTGIFFVHEDPTADSILYITIEELKETAALGDLDYLDADLQRAIAAASRGIDQMCNRRFYTNGTETRYYTPVSPQKIIVDDLVSVSELLTDQNFDGIFEETWAENDTFLLTPLNANANGQPYTRIELRIAWNVNKVFPVWSNRSVKVTGVFGWSSVPAGVIDATTIIATKLAKRKREAPFGIVTSTLDVGVAARIARNDPDVNFLLGPYMRELPT